MIKLLEFLWSGCFHNWEIIKERKMAKTSKMSYHNGGKTSNTQEYTEYTLRCKNCGHIKSINVGDQYD